jgi:DNA sulfur modification protein DndD
MILDELVLNNMGVFVGRNTIPLSPAEPGKPIILVGGLNGAGKTTILEAIHLALYGQLAETRSRRTGSYDAYLRSLIHHAADPGEGASVELAFHAHQEGAPCSYRVRRYWKVTGSGIRERVAVDVNGSVDGMLTQTWAEHVETFLPRGIAGLFFFDGEQIESLADLDRSRQVLGSALSALLGLDLVDRLATDLAVLRRRHRPGQLPGEIPGRVDAAETAAASARQAQQLAHEALSDARNHEERAVKRYAAATERYQAHGGDLAEQRASAEARETELRKEQSAVNDELRETAAGGAPLLLVAARVRELAERSRREADAAREQVVLDVIEARDSEVLGKLRDARVQASALSAVEAFLADDRERHRAAASAERVAGLTDPAPVDFLSSRVLPEARRKIQALLIRRAEVSMQLDAAERLRSAIPHPEAIAPLREEYELAREEHQRKAAERMRAEERLRIADSEQRQAMAARDKAVDDMISASLAADDDRRLTEHADKALATLATVKAESATRHLNRISALVLDSLRQLMRKENLITEITIDPLTQAVELRGSAGQPLSPEQLSVGERQLLAVALLWGLARASGQPLPVIIDTPLGRLDSAHRRHLLSRYFPHASHQVLLLSTDTEIDAGTWQQLAPHTGLTYRLDFDPRSGATTVRPGYFWEP